MIDQSLTTGQLRSTRFDRQHIRRVFRARIDSRSRLGVAIPSVRVRRTMPRSLKREFKLYPELQHFETREEAGRVLKAWQKKLMYSPKFALAAMGYSVVVGVTFTLISFYLLRWFGLSAILFGGIVAGPTCGTSTVVITWLWRRRCRRFLRAELISRGVPVCVQCCYDLRGQHVPRCPECGTSFDPELIVARTEQVG